MTLEKFNGVWSLLGALAARVGRHGSTSEANRAELRFGEMRLVFMEPGSLTRWAHARAALEDLPDVLVAERIRLDASKAAVAPRPSGKVKRGGRPKSDSSHDALIEGALRASPGVWLDYRMLGEEVGLEPGQVERAMTRARKRFEAEELVREELKGRVHWKYVAASASRSR